MRRALLLLGWIGYWALAWGQSCTILTWNIQDLGRSKSEAELAAMVSIMRSYDLVLIQEVVAKDPAGAQRVAQLADALDRTGSNWDYRVSDPTDSPSPYIRERYAMLWNSARLRLAKPPRLDTALAAVCDREPYLAAFRMKGHEQLFYVITFHARRFDQDPQSEIQHFATYPARLGTNCLLIAGDFNLDEEDPVWDRLKQQGFLPALTQTPTTLKRACKEGSYVNYPIDNLYFPTQCFTLRAAGCVDFVGSCDALETARGISDHLPVWVEIAWK
jgi:endonuclease/exonuclease/phosphatase family metal-dependent hydrolase